MSPAPQSTPLFLLSPDLQRLGHWLRAAGYDAKEFDAGILDNSDKDESIDSYYQLRHAKDEKRILLTTDPSCLALRGAEQHVLVLDISPLEQQIEQLSQTLQIDWLFAPLTRCLMCNHELTDPELSEQPDTNITFCTQCQQIVVEDEERQRVEQQLQQWQQVY